MILKSISEHKINLSEVNLIQLYSNTGIDFENPFYAQVLKENFEDKYKTISLNFTFSSYTNISLKNFKIYLENETLNVKKIIFDQIKYSSGIIVFALTIGEKLENLSKEFFMKGDYLEGYLIDKVASELTEYCADIFSDTIIKNDDFFYSLRYSPGYCGWNVAEQQKIFNLLPKEFTAIRLTESYLMIPVKSVSGIIGFGKKEFNNNYQCNICNEEFCIKRNNDNAARINK